MTVKEALGQIVLALAQPNKAAKIKAILEDLGKPNADLLEACEAALKGLGQGHTGANGLECSLCKDGGLRDVLFAAISKAKGEK